MTGTFQSNRSVSAIKIKRVARRLFAERGVDGVTIRDIAEAAGQKNHASVAYYFGSKEALVREILIDGVQLLDIALHKMLDEMESSDRPATLHEVAEAMVYGHITFGDAEDVDNFNRFVLLLEITHQKFFVETLHGRWNSGYLRYLNYLKELIPETSKTRINQKLIFVSRYVPAVMAARELKMSDTSRKHLIWEDESTLSHLVDTVVAILEA